MVITIHVVAHNGHPHTEPLSAEFDELGGSIGRGNDNTLVLPDPERHISRTHAAILFRAGRYVLRDKSSGTPVHVNGRALGQGHEAVIGDGDEIVIGVYTMRVATRQASSTTVASVPVPAAILPREPATPNLMDDPFAAPDARRSESIAPDFDPFAAPGKTVSAQPEHAWLPNDVDFDLGPSTTKNQRIDDLFGLGTVASADPCAPGNPLAKPDTAASKDPLAPSRSGAFTRYGRPQRNDVPELHGTFRPPQAKSNKPATRTASAPRAPQPVPATPPQAAKPGVPTTTPPVPNELLNAFLKGAGVQQLSLPGGLTPQTMEMLGALVREATQGTLNLLLARATIKREVRADRTMITARENNPLKLSPNVEVALTHLLAPQRGFMPPLKAMQDAHKDLCAHQFGVVAGMRAALAGVLQRFNPAQLAKRLTRKNVVDSLLPSHRKTKLWDLFEDLYDDVSREAEDDFHTLFGKEFLRAYEAQIEKLEQRGGGVAPGR